MKNRNSQSMIIIMIIFLLTAGTGFFQSSFADDDGFVSLINKKTKRAKKKKGPKTTVFTKHGWNHYGPGHFLIDEKTGVLQAVGGMGLFWYAKKFKDFILELDFKVDQAKANSGIFFRIPDMPADNGYIKKCFEIQICDTPKEKHDTGSIYSVKGTDVKVTTKGPNQWNHYKITCKGKNIKIELNGKLINNWDMKAPNGKVEEIFPEGYIGLQNHDKDTSTFFRNVRIKELK